MAAAAQSALDEAGLDRGEVDGVLCGYATTLPHLMLATLFCERFAIEPVYAHGIQMGGATGAGMLMLARELVRSGRCRRVLAVAGENRLSGQQRDSAIATLAQVGDPDFEVPNGTMVPTYYALLASRYMHESGLAEADLAAFAVAMRENASRHPDAHLRDPITLDDVLRSKPIASPLKLLDCCPISDGAVALVVSADPPRGARVAITGAGQAHRHQHVTAIADTRNFGARDSAARALEEAGIDRADVDYLAIYDSFTITLAILLEETGFAPFGGSAQLLRAGRFAPDGALPLNTHGGMLSFGHSGAGGGMGHLAETWRQLAGRAGGRQISPRRCAFVHADGGVLSAHVSLILAREG
jgi:acetyl-CoA acetyltransferase